MWNCRSASGSGAAPAAGGKPSKRKTVLGNYALPAAKKLKSEKAAADDSSAGNLAAAAQSDSAGGAAAAALPSPAMPYDELYAIFGDKLQPFLPVATPNQAEEEPLL